MSKGLRVSRYAFGNLDDLPEHAIELGFGKTL
jgi:hypothetical protein